MIRLIMFDLGDTLIRDQTPFPNVIEALNTISQFKTSEGEQLKLAIVSDFGDHETANTPSKIEALEAEFFDVLRTTGLEPFFQPFDSKVTISARAGASKPDRRVFEAAANRSGMDVDLSECLFVTENAQHLLAARNFGIAILAFGNNVTDLPSFSAWLDAPMRIAELIDPTNMRNHELAISLVLKTEKNIETFHCLNRTETTFRGQATSLVQLDNPELGEMRGAFIEMPVDVSVRCNHGAIDYVVIDQPSAGDIDDAVSYVQHLVRQGKVGTDSEQKASGMTHLIETDEQGRRILTRRRFSK